MKSELIQIFKNLPFNKDINKLKSLLQWIKNEFEIDVIVIDRIKNYDSTISEIVNSIYRNIFIDMKDDFIAELKRKIRKINLNESNIMKKNELVQLIKECIEELKEADELEPEEEIGGEKKKADPITDIDNVASVYSGKPGCMCGCKGTYKYASKWREASSKNRGYKVNDKEINDSSVKLIVNKMNTLLETEAYEEAERTDQYLFIDTGSRYYAAYFADYMNKENSNRK